MPWLILVCALLLRIVTKRTASHSPEDVSALPRTRSFDYLGGMDLQLSGHTALVTGSHRGTGQRIAARLAEEGATVLVHGFTLETASASCNDIGHGIAVAGDITTDGGAAELLAGCAAVAP